MLRPISAFTMEVSFAPQRVRVTIVTNQKVVGWCNTQELGRKVSTTLGNFWRLKEVV